MEIIKREVTTPNKKELKVLEKKEVNDVKILVVEETKIEGTVIEEGTPLSKVLENISFKDDDKLTLKESSNELKNELSDKAEIVTKNGQVWIKAAQSAQWMTLNNTNESLTEIENKILELKNDLYGERAKKVKAALIADEAFRAATANKAGYAENAAKADYADSSQTSEMAEESDYSLQSSNALKLDNLTLEQLKEEIQKRGSNISKSQEIIEGQKRIDGPEYYLINYLNQVIQERKESKYIGLELHGDESILTTYTTNNTIIQFAHISNQIFMRSKETINFGAWKTVSFKEEEAIKEVILYSDSNNNHRSIRMKLNSGEDLLICYGISAGVGRKGYTTVYMAETYADSSYMVLLTPQYGPIIGEKYDYNEGECIYAHHTYNENNGSFRIGNERTYGQTIYFRYMAIGKGSLYTSEDFNISFITKNITGEDAEESETITLDADQRGYIFHDGDIVVIEALGEKFKMPFINNGTAEYTIQYEGGLEVENQCNVMITYAGYKIQSISYKIYCRFLSGGDARDFSNGGYPVEITIEKAS